MAGLWACGARTQLPVGDDDGASVGGSGTGGEGGAGQGGQGGQGGVGGVEQLALGAGHTCLRTKVGDVYCWGRNADGQLGIGDDTTDQVLEPTKVDLGEPATYLAAGTYHTCAIGLSGQTFCWGKNLSKQVGVGSDQDKVFSPVPIGPPTAVALALGEAHSCVLLRSGSSRDLYCWGSGSDGQTGASMTIATPALIATDVKDVAAGAFHTCFLTSAGLVRCMGSNTDLQLGVLGINNTPTPTAPTGLDDVVMSSIGSSKGYHTCALSSGRAYCWGDNDEGQIGAGFKSSHELATSPAGLSRGTSFTMIAPGFAHTIAISGSVPLAWGSNYQGQLGFAGADAVTPMPLDLDGVIAIGSGTIHSCAYVSPLEIYCWGGNDFGQLGDGTTMSSSTPVAVVLP